MIPHSQHSIHEMSVAQSLRRWLPLTEVWNYWQVKHLPQEVKSYVICEMIENAGYFYMPRLYSLSEAPLYYRCWNKMFKRGIYRYLLFLQQMIKTTKCALLHSHFGSMGWYNLGIAHKLGVKHLVSFYGFDLSFLPRYEPIWSDRFNNLFAGVDGVLCEGRHMLEKLVRMGCSREKIFLHRLGIEVDNIQFIPRKIKKDETVKFLMAASFVEKKGIPYALEALGRMKDYLGKFHITIIGDARPQSVRSLAEKDRIMHVIRAYNLERHIRLLGFKTHDSLMEEAYRHHIFISPSVTASDGDTEGGAPVGIIEMAATGMPVITTTHCDIPGTLGELNRSMLSEEGDVEGLMEQVENLLAVKAWDDLGWQNRIHIEKEFSAVEQGNKLARIYSSFLRR